MAQDREEMRRSTQDVSPFCFGKGLLMFLQMKDVLSRGVMCRWF